MADYWQVIATNGRRQLVMYDAMTDEALARRLALMLKRQSAFTGIEYYLRHVRTAPVALDADDQALDDALDDALADEMTAEFFGDAGSDDSGDLAAHLRETVDELRGE